MRFLIKQQGMTLLEVMLVLVIAAGIVVLGIKQYQLYQQYAIVANVQKNVDVIFQSMAGFYRAFCNPNTAPTAPNSILAPTNNYPEFVAVSFSDLEPYSQAGNLMQLPISPLLNNTDPNLTYMMQFNLVTTNSGTALPKRTMTYSDGTTATVGNIYMWKAQVAIKLENPALAASYVNLLQANCASDVSTDGKSVKPCEENATATPTSAYVVFERLPSFSGSNMQSTYWSSLSRVKLFTQMYTNDNHDTSNSANNFYYCGS